MKGWRGLFPLWILVTGSGVLGCIGTERLIGTGSNTTRRYEVADSKDDNIVLIIPPDSNR